MANWQNDLKRGKTAEEEFAKKWPKLIPTSGFKGDFELPTGEIVELKTDSYCALKWPNVIIERYRSKEKAGGPYQSLEHGAKYYAYWFKKNDLLFLYDVVELIKLVDAIVIDKKLELQGIGNGSYTTRFYRVPRELLKDIELSHDILRS